MSTPASPGRTAAFAAYQVGQVIGAVSARLEEKRTSPPPRYTQDTLLDDMVNAHKFARNDAERKILKATEGLGTSRTRVKLIEGLVSRELLKTTKVGKAWQICTTDVARAMLQSVPDDLRNVAMTARWELALAGVRDGRFASDQVIAGGFKFVEGMCAHIKQLKAARAGGAPAGNRGSSSRP